MAQHEVTYRHRLADGRWTADFLGYRITGNRREALGQQVRLALAYAHGLSELGALCEMFPTQVAGLLEDAGVELI